MMGDSDIVVNRVNEIRTCKEINLTVKEFANKIGVTSRKINDIEQWRTALTPNVAVVIVKTFGASLDWLLMLSDEVGTPIKLKKEFYVDFDKPIDKKILSERIVELREDKNADSSIVTFVDKNTGLTQKSFAERIGVATSTIGIVEQMEKKKTLSLKTALMIYKEYGVSLDWLYGLSDEKYNPFGYRKAADFLHSYIEDSIKPKVFRLPKKETAPDSD